MKSAFSLHNIFGDRMVFQRGKPILVSGTAFPGVEVRGYFGTNFAECITDDSGEWRLEFPALEAGGPYELSVTSPTCGGRVLHDILVGDVWFCSGQSNMEFHVWCPTEKYYGLRDGIEVAKSACDDKLRLYNVPRAISPDGPCTENPLSPSWNSATSFDPVAVFSAVGYWFGAELRRRLGEGVPVGLINGSWGGTRIEPWIPLFGFEDAGRDKEIGQLEAALSIRRNRKSDAEPFDPFGGAYREWIENKFLKTDLRMTEAALASWYKPGNEPAAWKKCELGLCNDLLKVGTVWFRCEFELGDEAVGKAATVHIDHIDDGDEAWLDGEKIGETTAFTKDFWIIPRDYAFTVKSVPGNRHTLVLRVQNHFSVGSVSGNMKIVTASGETIDLSMLDWSSRVEFYVDPNFAGVRPDPSSPPEAALQSCQLPTTLFNSMTAPATEMNIRGVIWYQGCSNAGNPQDYEILQQLQIDSWRKAWRDPKMPFLITQLSAFAQHRPYDRMPDDYWKGEEPDDIPGYAFMREVQALFLDRPGAGVACTIDVGDHSDIHPADKKSVGIRLAHEAMRLAYGDASCLPGPRAAKAERVAGGVEISFSDAGGGIGVDEGRIGPHMLAVTGEDGVTVWTEGEMRGDKLFVSDAGRSTVTCVRYAFNAFAPGPFLRRNGDGLPVFPFRIAVR